MRRLALLLPLVVACRERPAGRATQATLRAPAPYRAVTGESGQVATLVVDGQPVDRADHGFGVHRLGGDSLLYRRVLTRQRTWYAPPDTETTFLLQGDGVRIRLADALPLFEDGFARPVVRGDTVYYWGVRRQGLHHGMVYAMRHVFATQHTDSVRFPHLRLGAVNQRPADAPVPGVDGSAFVGTAYRFAADGPAALVRADFRVWLRLP